ncbi:hypothetical protein [Paenibacillus thalictri]|nr:hypothetical protein [Paenibacillus thalictri]
MLRNKVDMKKAEAAVKRAGKQDNKRFRDDRTFAERQITVSTKAELQDAVDKRYGTIIVVGELAENVSQAYRVKDKLAQLEKVPQNATAATLAAVGVSETVIVTAIIALAVVFVVALFRNYDIDSDIQLINEQGDILPKIKLKLVRKNI